MVGGKRPVADLPDTAPERSAVSFYEGPPTANGPPGIHHVFGRTIKDIICRYRTMKGFRVSRRAGWDTHGLPVEISVEKELGLADREAIEQYGIANFNKACRQSVLRHKQSWDDLTRRIAYWVDLDHPYITFDNDYIESVWWLVSELHRRRLLYRGYKIQWYSPGSGTVLSSHEVSLGYREVDDPGAFVVFPAADDEKIGYLVWTTTPWTLPGNAALAVRADAAYVRVRLSDSKAVGGRDLILARDCLSALRQEYSIAGTFSGADLKKRRYKPPYESHEDAGNMANAWHVICADFVSMADGTGIVHIAPAFGADDDAAGRREDLPVINWIDTRGLFVDGAPLDLAGTWFKDADKRIMRDLRNRSLLYDLRTYQHNYPHDWRRGTPLMNYPVDSWFVRTTAIRDRLIQANKEINWHPSAIGVGRFGNWLEHNVDWALSRRRYWGTPVPIWVSDAPGSEYFEVIGSVADLRAKSGDVGWPGKEELDLHRPWIDNLTWPSPDGGTMRRVPEVLDVWFDSGAMPFAQWHYPFDNKEEFDHAFPADFIAEGLDQTRGWFYTLHALAVAVKDQPAYRNVLVNGLVLDEKGEKMSKSRGNVVDPVQILQKKGADVLRWYLISHSEPSENIRFDVSGLDEIRRKLFSTLEHTYAFFASYANIDDYNGSGDVIPVKRRTELDRWIISRLHSTVAGVDQALDRYEPTSAARALEVFVDDLSNWYVRRSRPRFWRARKSDGATLTHNDDIDKLAAYQTMAEVLYATAGAMAPIAPFFAEWLYRRLNSVLQWSGPLSVHLTDFPVTDDSLVDQALEQRMTTVRHIVTAALLLRNQAGHNVRQPLSRLSLACGPHVCEEDVRQMRDVILDEVNVQDMEFIPDVSDRIERRVRPCYPVLGPRLGAQVKSLAGRLSGLSVDEVATYLNEGRLVVPVDDKEIVLEKGDLEVEIIGRGDWQAVHTHGMVVALDMRLTEELRAQGLAREMVNRIQNLRKQAGLHLTDRIHVEYCGTGTLDQVLRSHSEWICRETLARSLCASDSPAGEHMADFVIVGQNWRVAIRRIAA